MTSNITTDISVRAIDPATLASIYERWVDERGYPVRAFSAVGWEPLRCCLQLPAGGEQISLIGYSPFAGNSPWAETGPVYIHAQLCPGYPDTERLPADLRTGPKILRSYRADQTLHYDHITVVPDGEDIEPHLRRLFEFSDVQTVHVRALASQCFAYHVTRRSSRSVPDAS